MVNESNVKKLLDNLDKAIEEHPENRAAYEQQKKAIERKRGDML